MNVKKLISSILSLGMVVSMMTAVPTAKAAELVNVAQGATVLNLDGTPCTTMGALVDGNTSTNTDAAKVANVIVDLGKRYQIDRISRNQHCGYQMVGIYVSNDINGEWKELLKGNYQDKALEETNVDGAYRYVKLTSEGQWAHICTSELYVYAEDIVGLAILDASQESGVARIDFNDTIDIDTISGITVQDAYGNPVVAEMSLSDDKYTVTFGVAGNKDLQVTIPNTVKTESGTAFAATTLNIPPNDVYSGRNSKTISINVAKGATVLNLDGTPCTTMGALVDGNTSTNTDAAKVANVIVDLGKRYQIDRISRNQLCGYQLVGIYVSNDINGEWKELLKGNYQGNVLETTNIDGTYRYVKLTSEGEWAHICTSELYVYTSYTVTDISTGKTAKASSAWDVYPASNAVDGTPGTSWISSNSGYSWMQVDLDEAQHIGYIELIGGNPHQDGTADSIFTLYGSNKDASEITDTSSATVSDATGLVTVAEGGITKYNSADIDACTYKAFVGDTNAYKYLLYKKNKSWNSSVGELTAYVINPEVAIMEMNDSVVTVTFDDDIVPASVEGNIKATSGNTEVSIENINVNGNVVTFTVAEPPAGELNITIDRFVRNMKSIPLAEDYVKTFTIEAPIVPELKVENFAISGERVAGQTVTASADVTNTLADEKDVILYIAVKNADKELVAVDFDTQKITTDGVAVPLSKGIALPADFDASTWTVEAFVWDKITRVPYIDKI